MAIKTSKLNALEKLFRSRCEDIVAERHLELSHFSPTIPVSELAGGGTLALQFAEGVPFLSVLDRYGKCEGVIGDDLGCDSDGVKEFFRSEDRPRLSESRKEFLLGVAASNWNSVRFTLDHVLSSKEYEGVKKMGFEHTDDVLATVMVDSVMLDDDSMGTAADFYHFARELGGQDSTRVRNAKEQAVTQTDNFFKKLYEDGMMDRTEVKEMIAHNHKDIESRFGIDNYLKGRLDMRYDNLCTLRGEYSVSEIARQAVWAQKNPEYATFLGPKLEDWVKARTQESGFSLKAVNAERVKLGGDVTVKKARPKLTEAQKNRFQRGI